MSYVIGIDFGATRIKIGAVILQGRILSGARKVIPSPRELIPEDFVRVCADGISNLVKKIPTSKKCLGVGVGVPGLVNTDRGTVQ